MSRVELVIQLRHVVRESEVNGLRLLGLRIHVTRSPVISIQSSEAIKPPEFVFDKGTAGIGVE